MTEKIFADGIVFRRPREGAPDFIKGSINIKVDAFLKFMKDNQQHQSGEGWFTLDLKQSQKGSLYLELNTWKPEKKDKSESELLIENIPF